MFATVLLSFALIHHLAPAIHTDKTLAGQFVDFAMFLKKTTGGKQLAFLSDFHILFFPKKLFIRLVDHSSIHAKNFIKSQDTLVLFDNQPTGR